MQAYVEETFGCKYNVNNVTRLPHKDTPERMYFLWCPGTDKTLHGEFWLNRYTLMFSRKQDEPRHNKSVTWDPIMDDTFA